MKFYSRPHKHDQDVSIAQDHKVDCNVEPSHLCESASQPGLPNQLRNAKALDSARKAYSFEIHCWRSPAASVRVEVKVKHQGKGRANSYSFFDINTTWCCLCLCRWLHWKQRFADCSGIACVTGRQGVTGCLHPACLSWAGSKLWRLSMQSAAAIRLLLPDTTLESC